MRLSSDEVDDAYYQYLDEVEDDAWAAALSGGTPDESPPARVAAMANDSE